MTETELRRLIGDPKVVDAELAQFRRSAEKFESDLRLVEEYAGQWVAVYEANVVAHSRTLSDLMRQIDEKGLPRGQTFVGYVERTPRKLIL
jgi:hypothetical protein